MDIDYASFADSSSTLSHCTTPAPSPRTGSFPQIWGLRRDPNSGGIRFAKRDSVVIRDSIAYPSESDFEETIVKGTAQAGQRHESKPRLIDLDRIRRKVQNAARRGSYRSTATETSVSTGTGGVRDPEAHQPEQDTLSRITNSQPVREAHRDSHTHSQNDVPLQIIIRPPSSSESQPVPQDITRSEQSSETLGSPEHETPPPAEIDNRAKSKHKRTCHPGCVIL